MEQWARDILVRVGIDDAASFTSGDVVELANLLSELSGWRSGRIPARQPYLGGPPAELLGALHGKVHHDLPGGRAAKSVKASVPVEGETLSALRDARRILADVKDRGPEMGGFYLLRVPELSALDAAVSALEAEGQRLREQRDQFKGLYESAEISVSNAYAHADHMESRCKAAEGELSALRLAAKAVLHEADRHTDNFNRLRALVSSPPEQDTPPAEAPPP